MWLLAFLLSGISCNFFKWTSYINFDDNTRWNKNVSRPCLESVVTFTYDDPTSIVISLDFTISDMTLPKNSELILSDGVLIGTDYAISDCQDYGEYVFDAGPDAFYDINNWEIYNTDPNSGGQPPSLLLDSELIPCQSDTVRFDSISTFAVSTPLIPRTLPNPSLSVAPAPIVKDISVWQKYINSDEALAAYKRDSVSGQFQFGDSEFIWGGQQQCDDAGCVCRADNYDGFALIEDYICQQINCTTDRVLPNCKEPVGPFGHCCDICGGIITMDFDSRFKIIDLEKYVLETINTDYPGNQLYYSIARIPPSEENYFPSVRQQKKDQIQVLVVDSDGTGSAAKSEVAAMKKGISKLAGVSNVVVTTSGRPLNGSSISGGAIFGIIFAVGVSGCIFGFMYKRYDLQYYLPAMPSITSRVIPYDAETGITNPGLEIPDITQTSEQSMTPDQPQSTIIDNAKSIVNPNFVDEEDSDDDDKIVTADIIESGDSGLVTLDHVSSLPVENVGFSSSPLDDILSLTVQAPAPIVTALVDPTIAAPIATPTIAAPAPEESLFTIDIQSPSPPSGETDLAAGATVTDNTDENNGLDIFNMSTAPRPVNTASDLPVESTSSLDFGVFD